MVATISVPALLCSFEVRHVTLSQSGIHPRIPAHYGGGRVSIKYTELNLL